MARETKYSEVLNLRIDPPLAREIQRIAARRGTSESDAARSLLSLGVDADRKIEAAHLMRPYDAKPDDLVPVLRVDWHRFDPEDAL
jgi:hypothetical protein